MDCGKKRKILIYTYESNFINIPFLQNWTENDKLHLSTHVITFRKCRTHSTIYSVIQRKLSEHIYLVRSTVQFLIGRFSFVYFQIAID